MEKEQEKNRRLLAAIKHQNGFDIDALLQTVASSLKATGHYLSGYTQYEVKDPKSHCPIMKLRNLKTDETTKISQTLGVESRGCRLDAGALADVSGKLENEIEPSSHLLVINRFGKAESDGHGFRNVIEKAFAMQVPVLTTVREPYVDAWHIFSGELGEVLRPEANDIIDWFNELHAEKAALTTMEV